ncbi:MAG: low molecular weight phosphotyrosine protein phosphatase [Treponema sp.]|nr:low molecular weight phosphotyrosine protein phosphatase [Treponema sp.]
MRQEKIKILFVCHGNICRSPMAEFVLKDLAAKAGLESVFIIDSAATSTEEIGNDIHPGTKNILKREGIPFTKRGARQITVADYEYYDFLIGMDDENLYYMNRRWREDPKGKIKLLMEFAGKRRPIADPWYTGNFDQVYIEIREGCEAIIREILMK